jgi:hypothetical protein
MTIPDRPTRNTAVKKFSAKFQRQFHQLFERTEEIELIHGDAVDLLSSSKEYSALVAFEQTLRTEALGFSSNELARLANIAGNAYANLKQPELSLARHEFAGDMLRASDGSLPPNIKGAQLEQFSYSLGQRVRRLVWLQRLDDARTVLEELRSLEQLTTDSWTRNRFWESSLVIAYKLRDDNLSEQVLVLTKAALAIPMFEPNDYTRSAELQLLNLTAQALRKLNRLDEAHEYCLLTMGFARPGRTLNDRDEIAWGILEGAFIGRLRVRPNDTLKFVDGLKPLLPLPDEDLQYAAVLRADAMISLDQLIPASQVLAEIKGVTPSWIESALMCTQARLAFESGQHEQAAELAQVLIDRFATDENCSDEVERAKLMLLRGSAQAKV